MIVGCQQHSETKKFRGFVQVYVNGTPKKEAAGKLMFDTAEEATADAEGWAKALIDPEFATMTSHYSNLSQEEAEDLAVNNGELRH